jgi:UPF0176 protein
MPFQRLKIRLKKEIVTLGDAALIRPAGRHLCRPSRLERSDRGAGHAFWIDTRNKSSGAGSFKGAVDPGIKSFRQFKDFAAQKLDPAKHRRIAMFCTGEHPLQKASVSAVARLRRGLSAQGRHPEIPRRRAGSAKPLARRMFCL